MNFIIKGYADKRLVVYPLLFALNQLGRTALVTDDTGFRRLTADGETKSDICNVTVFTVSPDFFRDKENIDRIIGDYEHAVFDLMPGSGEPELDKDALKIYAVRDRSRTGFTGGFGNDDYNKAPEGYIPVHIGFERPRDKTPFIPVTLALMKEIGKIERNRFIYPVKDGKTLAVLAPIFAARFGYGAGVMKKLMTKRQKGIKELY